VEGGKILPFSNIRFGLMWGGFTFAPDYCFSCNDPIGLEADISVGDAWLDKYSDDKTGSSLFAANTPVGKEIVEEMKKTGKIHLENETADNLLASQSTDHIKFKTSYNDARSTFFGGITIANGAPWRYIKLLQWIKFNKNLTEWLYRSEIVTKIPDIILRVYAKISMLIIVRLSKYQPNKELSNEK